MGPTESGGSSAALWNAFRSRTGRLGDRIAVESPAGEMTFGAMWDEADRLASRLLAAGIRENSIVGLSLGNSLRFVPAFLALCRIDSTIALLSPQLGPDELRPIADGVGLEGVVVETELAEEMSTAIPIVRSAGIDGLELMFPAEPGGGVRPAGSAAVLKFSSGSTAEPKGIALTALNLLAEAENVSATLELGPGDRVLAGVPLFHSYGFDLGVLPTLYAGTGLVIEDAFVPRRTLATLAGAGITAFLGLPVQYRAFLMTRVESGLDLAQARWLLSCTAPLSADTVTAFYDRFGVPIVQHYGSSETGAATTHVPSEVLRRPESVGRPMAGVTVVVVAEEGPAPPEAQGEVVIESAAVAERYVLGAPAGPSPLGNGAFRTGDLGSIDADGFLTLAGRRDAMINVGGLKVSPVEVAATLERHPDVREAAVLGVPDGHGEEVVYAVVALSGFVDEAELIAHCGRSLAEYKVPRRIEIRGALPRTAAGKVRLKLEDLSV